MSDKPGRPRDGFVGAGGTPGGVGEFFLGVVLIAAGLYLLFSHVQVHTSYWHFAGRGMGFGISLVPMLAGITALFINGNSTIGWALTVGGLLFILAGILMNMDIYFQRTSLLVTLMMLGLPAVGLGLVIKSLRPHARR